LTVWYFDVNGLSQFAKWTLPKGPIGSSLFSKAVETVASINCIQQE
jgi:hypothetical protein